LEDPADLGSPRSYAVEVLAAEDDHDLESAAGGRLQVAALGRAPPQCTHASCLLWWSFSRTLLICEWDSRSIGFWVVCADRLLLAGCGELAHE